MSRYTDFQRDGYVIHYRPVIPEDLVRRAMKGMDDVLAGQYETGIPPQSSYWNPGDDPNKLAKVEMPQLANSAIMELVSHPALGRLAAEVTGAKKVQVWWVQLLSKPPARTDSGSGVSVGWHQDRQYWKAWKEGSDLFTAWVAVSDVGPDTGPMVFVKGSHKWGLLNQGDFYFDDIEIQREQITLPPGASWREVEAILPPGGVSFHHCLTFHGSRPNRSGAPRRSFAIHMRTEKSCPVSQPEGTLAQFIHRPDYCPVVYTANGTDSTLLS
jgi:ectoine hydroxylase-related dioxygenase (phytanoyl-CoA dioxygenase family)